MYDLALAVTTLRRALFAETDHADSFNALIEIGMSATDDARTDAIRALLEGVIGAPATIVGELAVASGALVEQGGSPTEGLGALLDALADGANTLAASGPALGAADLDRGVAPPQLAPEARDWTLAFRRVVVGTMARLARSVAARDEARAHPRLGSAIRAIGEQIDAWHVVYIVEILDMLDDALLLLVDTSVNTISHLRVTGIRNCFHLMTLLEGDDSTSTSRGYYTWRYLGVTSGLAIEIIQTMIPGDLRAVDLPQFDGTRVVVRTPTGVQRSWGRSFVSPIHDALRSTIVVERVLPGPEADALREKMSRTT